MSAYVRGARLRGDTMGMRRGIEMKIRLDREADALYFRLDDGTIEDSEEVRPGIVLDYDANGTVVGVEFLNVSTRAAEDALTSLQYQSR